MIFLKILNKHFKGPFDIAFLRNKLLILKN